MGKRYIPRPGRGEKKKSAGASAAALAVCLVLIAVLTGVVIGRYQTRIKAGAAVRVPEFYFTSDFLDGGTHTLAPGSTEVSFTLGNHADDLRFSEVDIDYTITVTSDNGTTATVKNSAGTLEKNTLADAEITISDLQAGTYTITATGKGGFEKELKATVRVLPSGAQLYQHQETVPGEYILLTVWNEGETAGDVTIKYTGIPDNTNPNMRSLETDGSIQVQIDPHESKVFRFFGGTLTVTGAADKEPG